jgi:hypothetical protein
VGGSKTETQRPDSKPYTPPALDDENYLPEVPKKRATIVIEEPTPLTGQPRQAIVPEEPQPQLDVAGTSTEALAQPSSYGEKSLSPPTDWHAEDEIEVEMPLPRPAVVDELHLESARNRGLVRTYNAPEAPRWTFFSGVFTYPWRGVNLTRWTAIAFGLSLAGSTGLMTLQLLGLLDGALGVGAVAGVVAAMLTIGLVVAVLSFAASSCQAAIQDTADGHDEPQEASLPDWDHWVITFLGWLMLWGGAAAVGYPLSLLIGPIAFLVSATLLFPVLILSAMESDSYLLPFSPPILRTLGYYLHGWLTFYLLTLAMFATWVAAFDFGFARSPYLTVLLSGPVLAALMLIYARLLGRVAWRASGAPAAPRELEDKPTVDAAPKPIALKPAKRKKRKSRRIEIPDEIDPGQGPRQPPRLNFHLRH